MADFLQAFERTFNEEGGMKLTNLNADRGGQTFAGISRRNHPGWEGWKLIDRGETPPERMVRDFYRVEFWDLLKGDQINIQEVAFSLFDFAVNAGPVTSVKLLQIAAGVQADGKMGPKTLGAINGTDPHLLLALFALAKISRYHEICRKDKTQRQFLMGWVGRALRSAT